MELNVIEIAALVLFLLGVLGILWNRNIIKTTICIAIVDIAAVLFFIGINYKKGMDAPIGETVDAADPVAQAIMITTIVIGIAVTAVALMMFIAMYHRYGTTDWHKALDMRNKEK